MLGYVLLVWQGFGLPGSGEAASRDVPGWGYKVLLLLWLPSCLQTQGDGLCGCHHAVGKGQGGLLQETGARSAAVAQSVLKSPSHKAGTVGDCASCAFALRQDTEGQRRGVLSTP